MADVTERLSEAELDQLECLAKAAEETDPGGWVDGPRDDSGQFVERPGGEWVASTDTTEAREHIAAFDPPTALRLIVQARLAAALSRPSAEKGENRKLNSQVIEALRSHDNRGIGPIDPKASYATKPRALLDLAAQCLEDLSDDVLRLHREKMAALYPAAPPQPATGLEREAVARVIARRCTGWRTDFPPNGDDYTAADQVIALAEGGAK